MQILLADAKTMRADVPALPGGLSLSEPAFGKVARELAGEMGSFSIEELRGMLGGSRKVNEETSGRYRDFPVTEPRAALLAYTGQAYRHLRAEDFGSEELLFAQKKLFITSFLYGLLRPLDGIKPYRMEEFVRLEVTGDVPMNRFWRPLLTDFLLSRAKGDGGTLLQLSTEEFEKLFEWKRVTEEVRVVKPYFYVRTGGALKVQAVWAKSCRGAMLREIIKGGLDSPEELKAFSYEGFRYAPDHGDEDHLYFIREG